MSCIKEPLILSEYLSQIEYLTQNADEISEHLLAIERALSSFSGISLPLCSQIPSQYSLDTYSELLEELTQYISSYMSSIDFDNISSLLNTLQENSQPISHPSISSDFVNSLERLSKYSSSKQAEAVNCESDHVILNEASIREYKIPDAIAISTGHGRVRIKTSDFISIISLIFQLIFAIIGLLPSAPVKTEAEQIQIEETQALLLESQNQILRNLFYNIDLSSSSQAEALQSLIEIVEAQNSAISDLEESLDSIQRSLDNMNGSENTEPEKNYRTSVHCYHCQVERSQCSYLTF